MNYRKRQEKTVLYSKHILAWCALLIMFLSEWKGRIITEEHEFSFVSYIYLCVCNYI